MDEDADGGKIAVKVPSKDPAQPEKVEMEKMAVDDGDDKETEEDKLLRERLETAANKLIGSESFDLPLFEQAISLLTKEIQSATSSLTSVPKPLKYLRNSYDGLKAVYGKWKGKNKELWKQLADILSVLGMTMARDGSREMLEFKLSGNTKALGVWGHEYVRSLSGEIASEFSALSEETEGDAGARDTKKKLLQGLVKEIVPFLIEQNTEVEAVDLLLEVDMLNFLVSLKLIDKTNCERTCLYLIRFAEFLFDEAEVKDVLTVAYELYRQCDDLPNALRVAMKMNDPGLATEVVSTTYGGTEEDAAAMKTQLCLILGSNRNFWDDDWEESEFLHDCVNNRQLGEFFKDLATSLNMTDPKSPDDVYKTHLSEVNTFEDSKNQNATDNLGSTYVNAFVNAGFLTDTYFRKKGETKTDFQWVYKNRDSGVIAGVASLGMIHLWDPDTGQNEMNRWIDIEEANHDIMAGGALGMGIITSGVSDNETAAAVVSELFRSEHKKAKDIQFQKVLGAGSLGLGIAYAGNPNDEAATAVINALWDSDPNKQTKAAYDRNALKTSGLAALSLGLMFLGLGPDAEFNLTYEDGEDVSRTESVGEALCKFIFDMDETLMNTPGGWMFALGLGLVYMGVQDKVEAMIGAVQAIENVQYAKLCEVLLHSCAYAGSGNVIQIQKLLHLCAEHLNEHGLNEEEAAEESKVEPEQSDSSESKTADAAEGGEAVEAAVPEGEEKEVDKELVALNSIHQTAAVIGVALIACGESVGQQMAERTFQHLLQYGELSVRRGVPLALALLHVSDPQYAIVDILSKLSHDSDTNVCLNAILGLGIIAAGTTNSRVAAVLRSLASFYEKNAARLLIVRYAQALLFAGKGLVTMHPFHSDKSLLNKPALGGILTVLISAFDVNQTLTQDLHYLLYTLSLAMRPRTLMTFVRQGDHLEQVKVPVRVGQAVDTVGQAGSPKKITGFQSQETPILLNVGDRAELATDEYEPYSSILEGFIVLKKLPKKEGVDDK